VTSTRRLLLSNSCGFTMGFTHRPSRSGRLIAWGIRYVILAFLYVFEFV
jgi:hypothetical protein